VLIVTENSSTYSSTAVRQYSVYLLYLSCTELEAKAQKDFGGISA